MGQDVLPKGKGLVYVCSGWGKGRTIILILHDVCRLGRHLDPLVPHGHGCQLIVVKPKVSQQWRVIELAKPTNINGIARCHRGVFSEIHISRFERLDTQQQHKCGDTTCSPLCTAQHRYRSNLMHCIVAVRKQVVDLARVHTHDSKQQVA